MGHHNSKHEPLAPSHHHLVHESINYRCLHMAYVLLAEKSNLIAKSSDEKKLLSKIRDEISVSYMKKLNSLNGSEKASAMLRKIITNLQNGEISMFDKVLAFLEEEHPNISVPLIDRLHDIDGVTGKLQEIVNAIADDQSSDKIKQLVDAGGSQLQHALFLESLQYVNPSCFSSDDLNAEATDKEILLFHHVTSRIKPKTNEHLLQIHNKIFATALIDLHQHQSELFHTADQRCEFGIKRLVDIGPNLVNSPAIDDIIDHLTEYLSPDEYQVITSKAIVGDRMLTLSDIIQKKLHCKDSHLFQQFLVALSGIAPDLFECFTKRSPTEEEAMACMEGHVCKLKKTIIETGHQIDKITDTRIDLEKNYVKLRLTQTQKCVSAAHLDPEHPVAYQASLSRGDRDIEDVVEDMGSSGHFCLIEGRSGIGKTTMSQNLCRRWANNYCLKEIYFIFHIPIRRLMVMKKELSLYELVTKYSLFPNKFPSRLLENWSEHVLVNLDGLDELDKLSDKMLNVREIADIHEKGNPDEICLNLLKRNLLPKTNLVCTSRSFAGLKYLRPDVKLEVMGLTAEGVHEFIDRNVLDESKERVKSNLVNNPILLSVCSITFYASHLCRIMSRMMTSLSDRDLDTYTRLTAFLISEYPKRQQGDTIDQSVFDNCYQTLAKIALHAETGAENALRKISFDFDLIRDICSNEDLDAIKEAQKNGVIHITEFDVDGVHKNILEFPHFSMQEFFAALQLVRDDNTSSEEFLHGLFQGETLNMLQLFLFGAVFDSGDNSPLSHIRKKIGISDGKEKLISKYFKASLLPDMSKNAILKATLIAHEAQNQELARSVGQKISTDDGIAIKDTPLNALDMKALSFVFSHCSVSTLNLANTNLDDYSLGILASSFKEKSTLKTLNLSDSQMSEHGLRYLRDLVHHNPDIEELVLDGNKINDTMLKQLLSPFGMRTTTMAEERTVSNESEVMVGIPANQKCQDCGEMNEEVKDIAAKKLKHLSLNNTQLTLDGAKLLKCHMDILPSLSLINLSGARIEMQDTIKLIDIFSTSPNPLRLNLSNKQIIVEKLSNEASFPGHILDLSNRSMTNQNVVELASIMRRDIINTIDLRNNRITSNVAGLLKLFCLCCRKLTSIHVSKTVFSNGVHENLLRTERSKFVEIDLSGRKITESVLCLLQRAVHDAKVEKVTLVDSGIKEEGCFILADALRINASITDIDISANGIGEEGGLALAEALKFNKSITNIDLSFNEIGDKGGIAIAEALKINRSITNIHLNATEIGEKGGIALAEAFKINNSVTNIYLCDNKIGEKGGLALAKALKVNQSITSIHLKMNQIGQKGGLALADALKNNDIINNINLNANNIGEKEGLALAEALKVNKSITCISLKQNQLGQKGGIAIAEALKINKSITSIGLAQNGIGEKGGLALAEALQFNKHITKIDLSSNDIRELGSIALAEALKTKDYITKIDLHDNGIGEKGGIAIAHALKINTSITNIDLSGNEIGDEGGLVLSQALKVNKSITNIHIDSNGIGEKGGLALADALNINSSIGHIHLKRNRIGQAGGIALADALKINTTITSIDLSFNGIGEKGGLALAEALKVNKSITNIDISANGIGEKGSLAISEALKINKSITNINVRGSKIWRMSSIADKSELCLKD